MATRKPARILSCWMIRCALALLLSTSSGVFAQPPGCDQSAPGSAPANSEPTAETDSPSVAGLRAFIDPQTGELVSVPPPGSVPETAATAAQDRPELVEEVLPDGTVIVRLDDRFQHPLQAELQGDELITCHGGPDQHD